MKVDLPLPIVASNLMIEFADFYENYQASTETLQCPRCSASVPANPGVCGNCGENVYQCHKCRCATGASQVSCMPCVSQEERRRGQFCRVGPSQWRIMAVESVGFTDTGEGGGELWGGGWGGVPEFSSGSLLWLPDCLSCPCPFAAAPPRALRGSQRLQMWRMRSLSALPSAAP